MRWQIIPTHRAGGDAALDVSRGRMADDCPAHIAVMRSDKDSVQGALHDNAFLFRCAHVTAFFFFFFSSSSFLGLPGNRGASLSLAGTVRRRSTSGKKNQFILELVLQNGSVRPKLTTAGTWLGDGPPRQRVAHLFMSV